MSQRERPGRGVPERFKILGLTFACFAISYLDRLNLSVAAPAIMQERGLDEAQMGAILAAFFWGFAVAHPIGGWLADRYGGKRVLAAGAAWWSLWTLLTPFAAASLLPARVMLGLGEGVNTPAMHSMFGRWFPPEERTRAVAFNLSGIQIGTIVAFPLSTWILLRFGWRAIFYAYAAVGLVWVAAWWRVARDHPEDAAAANAAGAGPPASAHREPTPWRALLRSRAVWAILLCTCCTNWVAFLFFTWLPTYLVKSQGFSLKAMGFYATLPYVAAIVLGNAAGLLADRLIRRGVDPTRVRKSFFVVGMSAAALLLYALRAPHEPLVVVALLTLTQGAFAVGGSTIAVNSIDVAPRHAGTMTGLQGLLGNVAGGFSPWVAGEIVARTGSWENVFLAAAAVAALGVVVYAVLGSGRPIDLAASPAPDAARAAAGGAG